jgi:hypothetical protein
MGFKNAKQQLLNCIDAGNVQHEIRHDIDVKNLLYSGAVSMADVKAAVLAANGNDYECSPHHQMKSIDVHIIKVPRGALKNWYIKWYFIAPDAWFISVHN